MDSNGVSEFKDDVIKYLDAIAFSYSEETLNKAARELEESDVWKMSDKMRNWFQSNWLAQAKVSPDPKSSWKFFSFCFEKGYQYQTNTRELISKLATFFFEELMIQFVPHIENIPSVFKPFSFEEVRKITTS